MIVTSATVHPNGIFFPWDGDELRQIEVYDVYLDICTTDLDSPFLRLVRVRAISAEMAVSLAIRIAHLTGDPVEKLGFIEKMRELVTARASPAADHAPADPAAHA